VVLGIGDDAALLVPPHGTQLVQTIDTLIEGRHFPAQTSPEDIAWKSLAVNVSDLAAMAATPWCFLLSLTLPDDDPGFLKRFSQGLFEAAQAFGIRLVGGDTCRGALSITIQASGYVESETAVTRGGAQVGDHIFVSGPLGLGALGLASINGQIALPSQDQQLGELKLNRPQPRIDLVELLRCHASAAIDVSDGLVADLGHILENSKVGALLGQAQLPVPSWIRGNDEYRYALAGGDDYELVFTVPAESLEPMLQEAQANNLEINEIGIITEHGFELEQGNNRLDLSDYRGFDHFAK
jgi:thiamine-monophosphate kinase